MDYTFEGEGEDEYRCFVVDPQLEEWTWLRALWVWSSNPRMVHHAGAWAAPPDQVEAIEQLDAEDPGPGWPCYGGPEFQGFGIGGYAPGAQPISFPNGTAVPVEPGTKFVVEMHYYALHGREPNRMKLQGWEAPEGTDEFPWTAGLQTFDFFIPAGDPSVVATTDVEVIPRGETPAQGQVEAGLAWAGGIHMHLLGKDGRITLIRENGDRECLLHIPNWNDDWQGDYRFAEPVELRPGDKVELRCEWDNTESNQGVIDGEKLEPKDTQWGFGVRDEMCNGGVLITDE